MIIYRELHWDSAAEKQRFKELHNVLFKSTAITDHWIDWYFTIAKNVRVYGAFDDTNLVGMWCVESKTLRANDGRIPVGRCFSVGVHPSYQRRGIFLHLSSFAIEQEKKLNEHRFILGFPQAGRTVIDGHLKAGWEFVQDIEAYSIRPNIVDGNVSLKAFATPQQFKLATGEPIGTFLDDCKYLTQRWLDHPHHDYICREFGSDYIVMKPYGDSCHIVHLSGLPASIEHFLEAAKMLGRSHGWKEINMWCASNSRFVEVVRSCGFVPRSERILPIKLLAVKIGSKDSLKLSSCDFQMGVEEPY